MSTGCTTLLLVLVFAVEYQGLELLPTSTYGKHPVICAVTPLSVISLRPGCPQTGVVQRNKTNSRTTRGDRLETLQSHQLLERLAKGLVEGHIKILEIPRAIRDKTELNKSDRINHLHDPQILVLELWWQYSPRDEGTIPPLLQPLGPKSSLGGPVDADEGCVGAEQ